MGKKGLGLLGTGTNAPVIDPGTLGVKKSSPPIHAGKRSTVKPDRTHAAAFSFRNLPKAFVVIGQNVKAMLPNEIWRKAAARVDSLFHNAGGLTVSIIGSTNALSLLNLVDAVVECHRESRGASDSFKATVLAELGKYSSKYPELQTVAAKFRQADYHSVDVGRSFAVKEIFQSPPFRPELVCISFGVVSLHAAFQIWNGILKPRTKTTLQTIGSAALPEQTGFAITLGNVIAHEARHQLGLSRTGVGILPVHAGSGVGSDQSSLRDSALTFTDGDAIIASLAKLKQVQSDHLASQL